MLGGISGQFSSGQFAVGSFQWAVLQWAVRSVERKVFFKYKETKVSVFLNAGFLLNTKIQRNKGVGVFEF
jgi:hypothetical protein